MLERCELSSLGSASVRHNYQTMEDDETSNGYLGKGEVSSRKWWKIPLIVILLLLVIAVLVVYVVIPAVFYSSSSIRRTFLFKAFTASPDGLNDPESLGLSCARNFFTTSDPHIRIGTWYVQSNGTECVADSIWYPNETKTVLYLHGVTRSRSAKNRLKLLEVLTGEVHVHAIAIDYRGFGDSTYELPSLGGVVADSLAAYRRLRLVRPSNRIVIWGHSLGTAVLMQLAAKLKEDKDSPSAIILEAPLDDIASVVVYNGIMLPYRWIPWYRSFLAGSLMKDPKTAFNSTAMIPLVDTNVPILILHARDDTTVPFINGLHLYETFRTFRSSRKSSAPVSFVSFGAEQHFGHNYIVFYPKLGDIIKRFLEDGKI